MTQGYPVPVAIMTVLQIKLRMTRRGRRNMTVLQTKLGMTRKEEHDNVADKARNEKKARKEEHESVADIAKNDEERGT